LKLRVKRLEGELEASTTEVAKLKETEEVHQRVRISLRAFVAIVAICCGFVLSLNMFYLLWSLCR
jgi:hypothetical protein